MPDRAKFHLVPNVNGWELKREGSDETEILVDDKSRALELARERVRSEEPSQLIVHTQDGKIETEFTYGDDPANIPG